MNRQEFLKEIKLLTKPSGVKIISLIIIVGLSVMGAIVINNVNKELTIREVASKLQQYKYSILSFNNIYSGLPGDIENATFYWKDETANGNNNRKIELEGKEAIYAWQHLQMAKLLNSHKKKITPKWAGEMPEKFSNINNSPSAAIKESIFYFKYSDIFSLNQIFFAKQIAVGGYPEKAILTPEQAYMLDLMIDDGYPESGNLNSFGEDENSCKLAGEYKAEGDSVECYSAFNI